MYVHFSSWEERIFWNRIFEWPCNLAACRETRLTDCTFPALAPIHPIISSAHRLNWVEIKLFHFDSKQSLAGSDCWSNRMHVEGEEVQRQQPPRESSLLILHFNQIHFSIWTNTFGYLDKYILKFGHIHFETWTREYKCRGNSCTGKATSSIQTFPNSCHTFSLSCNKKYKAQFHNFKKYTMQFNQH